MAARWTGGVRRSARLTAVDQLEDMRIVRGGEREQADFFIAGVGQRLSRWRSTISSTVRSRTGRVIIPAWQKRQPRVQPRMISTGTRLWTVSM